MATQQHTWGTGGTEMVEVTFIALDVHVVSQGIEWAQLRKEIPQWSSLDVRVSL